MTVVYTAPNRAHHYRYALALHRAGMLHAFISGFPRFSPKAKEAELGSALHRADLLQTTYLASLKVGAPDKVSSCLAYLSKIEQDLMCKRYLNGCSLFVFYNGSGLISCQQARRRSIVTVVEAVNSHVAYQEEILKEEHQKIGLSWTPFHKKEKERRIREYDQADYILTPSDFVKKSFTDYGYPERKLLKVPYGFDAPPVGSVKRDSDNFTVLYVGSISIRKGLRYLIQAFASIQHPRKKLIIVGPRSMPDGLHDLNIPNEVTFTGVLKGESLKEMYQLADVFCLPTLEDGFGLVLGEALSYGLPVITTTNSGGHDLLTDGKEGFIVPIRNAVSIGEKLQLLADDIPLRHSMHLAAQAKTSSIKGWDDTGNLLTTTLKGLLIKS